MTEPQQTTPPHSDADTVAYFDDVVPEYDAGRLDRSAEFIRSNGDEGKSVVDIGCGVGNTLPSSVTTPRYQASPGSTRAPTASR